MKKISILIFVLFQVFYLFGNQREISLIPEPKSIKEGTGRFVLSAKTRIQINNDAIKKSADLFNEFMSSRYNMNLSRGSSGKNTIKLVVGQQAEKESYRLTVNDDGILIQGDEASVFYGLQTLQQLIKEKDGILIVPYVEIEDEPRFPHRGMMLDVARYYYKPQFVKHFIDLMSHYKINRFHWHLTEDGGWRIEIKKYPELTKKGAWRTSTQKSRDKQDQDRLPHGGFYTQEEIKDIIAYAADRHITIIPEIDLPGHTMSVLSVFPDLSCTGGPFAVPIEWGIKDDILCAGNESVYEFVENVLAEVIDLFPSEYIHIGGDEAPKKHWKECPKCQAKIKAEGLKDEHELQSYFVQRVEKFVNSKGRQIIGWDEILEGGLAPNATVMSWRGEAGGITAANMGHKVIMSPNIYMYLDYYQAADRSTEPFNIGGCVPLDVTYNYEPYSPKITPEQQKYIIGVQGHIWGEYIHSEDMVEYMGYPRALALSEIGWSQASKKDYNNFLDRLPARLDDLDKKGVLFRIPEPKGWNEAKVANGKVLIDLKPLIDGAEIYYTTDGTDPLVYGKFYTQPLSLPLSFGGINVKCIVRLSSGRSSAVYTIKEGI